jgi:hypothetical protein
MKDLISQNESKEWWLPEAEAIEANVVEEMMVKLHKITIRQKEFVQEGYSTWPLWLIIISCIAKNVKKSI